VLVSANEIDWFTSYFIKKLSPIEDTNFYVINIKGELNEWEYCKLAKEPKEEVTFDDIDREMNKTVTAEEFELGFNEFCNKNKGDYNKCKSSCKYYEVSRYNCDLLWILDNYNVTRKDNK
ncbi:hypothetical protein, partial [Clostridium perfringens]|uniref:hypothetical protein n=1 Tax=Clostridium perfringens TaxID=1502 RepID=UPI00232F9154